MTLSLGALALLEMEQHIVSVSQETEGRNNEFAASIQQENRTSCAVPAQYRCGRCEWLSQGSKLLSVQVSWMLVLMFKLEFSDREGFTEKWSCTREDGKQAEKQGATERLRVTSIQDRCAFVGPPQQPSY
jgi:hypothetical protein